MTNEEKANKLLPKNSCEYAKLIYDYKGLQIYMTAIKGDERIRLGPPRYIIVSGGRAHWADNDELRIINEI